MGPVNFRIFTWPTFVEYCFLNHQFTLVQIKLIVFQLASSKTIWTGAICAAILKIASFISATPLAAHPTELIPTVAVTRPPWRVTAQLGLPPNCPSI
jgi:hypothetical protein